MCQFMISNEGVNIIDASLDEEYIKLEFNASKINTNSTIVIPSNVNVGKTINITGIELMKMIILQLIFRLLLLLMVLVIM